MYRRNIEVSLVVPTIPWGTHDVTICVSEWEPFTSTCMVSSVCQEGIYPVESVVSDSVAI